MKIALIGWPQGGVLSYNVMIFYIFSPHFFNLLNCCKYSLRSMIHLNKRTTSIPELETARFRRYTQHCESRDILVREVFLSSFSSKILSHKALRSSKVSRFVQNSKLRKLFQPITELSNKITALLKWGWVPGTSNPEASTFGIASI